MKIGDIYIDSSDNKQVITKEGYQLGIFPLDSPEYTISCSKAGKKKEDIKHCFGVGDKIQGFCGGFFGRDDYELKECVAVFPEFIVFKYLSGYGVVLNLHRLKETYKDLMWSYVECWRKDE